VINLRRLLADAGVNRPFRKVLLRPNHRPNAAAVTGQRAGIAASASRRCDFTRKEAVPCHSLPPCATSFSLSIVRNAVTRWLRRALGSWGCLGSSAGVADTPCRSPMGQTRTIRESCSIDRPTRLKPGFPALPGCAATDHGPGAGYRLNAAQPRAHRQGRSDAPLRRRHPIISDLPFTIQEISASLLPLSVFQLRQHGRAGR
jgi:hypothetical protein